MRQRRNPTHTTNSPKNWASKLSGQDTIKTNRYKAIHVYFGSAAHMLLNINVTVFYCAKNKQNTQTMACPSGDRQEYRRNILQKTESAAHMYKYQGQCGVKVQGAR